MLDKKVQEGIDKVHRRIVQHEEGRWVMLMVQEQAIDAAGVQTELAGITRTLLSLMNDAELLAWAKTQVPGLTDAKKNELDKRKKELERILEAMGGAG